jgi:hypothetical protein
MFHSDSTWLVTCETFSSHATKCVYLLRKRFAVVVRLQANLDRWVYFCESPECKNIWKSGHKGGWAEPQDWRRQQHYIYNMSMQMFGQKKNRRFATFYCLAAAASLKSYGPTERNPMCKVSSNTQQLLLQLIRKSRGIPTSLHFLRSWKLH